MKYIKQFATIIFITFLGEILSYLIPLPIPAAIYGIVIMFTCLMANIVPLDYVKDTAHFLVDIMAIMFIPASVGLINCWDIVKDSLVQYVIIVVVTTVTVMGITGRVTQEVAKRGKK